MVIIDNLVPQGSIMPDNLRSDTARASLEYKNQLKKAGDIYVGTGTKITNDEAGVSKEIYVTEGKNIQKALNEDIFRVGGKNNIGLTNSDLSSYSNNIGIGKDISIIGNNNILIGNGAKTPISNEYAVIIGDKASSYAGGITIGRNAVSAGTNVVTIGDNADNKAESGIVIGSASATSAAVSGIALGGSAQVQAPNAVQIGKGVNLVENSLQFHNTQIVGGDGHVNATKINGVLSTDIFENDKKTVKDATNVTGTIGGRLITNIFDGSTTTVQMATNTQNTDFTNIAWNSSSIRIPSAAQELDSKYVYEILVQTELPHTAVGAYGVGNFHALVSFAGMQTSSSYYFPIGTVSYIGSDLKAYICSVSLEAKYTQVAAATYGWMYKAMLRTAPFGKTGDVTVTDVSISLKWRRIR